MMKWLKAASAALMLAALMVGQLPSAGNGQMGYGRFLAKSLPMPSSTTKLPMPNCPMMRASAPRDFLTSSVPILGSTLIALHDSLQVALSGLRPVSQVLGNLAAVLQLLIAGPVPSVRAPPSDVHLIDA